MDWIFFQLKKEIPLMIIILLTLIAVSAQEMNRKSYFKKKYYNPSGIPNRTVIPYSFIPKYFKNWRNQYLKINESLDPTGLARGIFLGEDSFISTPTRTLFHNAGLAHLLSASGYNCWIVAFVFQWIIFSVFLLIEPYLPTTITLRLRLWLPNLTLFVGSWFFWLWSTQSPPITRSVILISLKFVLNLFHLNVSFVRLVLLQYLFSLIFLPVLWHSASFQLTFGCLFGILLLPAYVKNFFQPQNHALNTMYTYFLVSLGACLGAIPTTWLVFGEINFTSILTNWFAIPIVSFGIMPIGLFQMLLLGLPFQIDSIYFAIELLGKLNGFLVKILFSSLSYYMEVIPSLRYVD